MEKVIIAGAVRTPVGSYGGALKNVTAAKLGAIVIGEALKRLRDLDPQTAHLIPDIHRIIALRNILAHGYAVVDDGVVWSAATHRVPELATLAATMVNESGGLRNQQ